MKVEYIDHMGDDLSVIRAATASFAKDPAEWDETNHPRLINYLSRGVTNAEYEQIVKSAFSLGGLMEDMPSGGGQADLVERMIGLLEKYRHTPTHWSPFAHTAITLRLKAPIAIHAQVMKHTVGFAHNTVSRRYVRETPELFVPIFRHAPNGNVKQGSGDVITEAVLKDGDGGIHTISGTKLQEWYKAMADDCIGFYEAMIEGGVAPEQARFVLPQGVMTEWVSTGSLYAWARFYNLRTDSHAQKEIQDLAHMVGEIIEPLYPVSWKALTR